MTDHPFYDQFRDLGWRRKLTPFEDAQLAAWLQAHPEMQAQWDSDVGLTDALSRLPDTPVSSNFTARVLAAAQRPQTRHDSAQTRQIRFWHRLLAWRPRLAFAAVVLLAGVISIGYVRSTQRHRAELANGVKTFSQVAALQDNILQDFDTIQRLSGTPPPDEELLKLLQ